jgi:hypothetical protein
MLFLYMPDVLEARALAERLETESQRKKKAAKFAEGFHKLIRNDLCDRCK